MIRTGSLRSYCQQRTKGNGAKIMMGTDFIKTPISNTLILKCAVILGHMPTDTTNFQTDFKTETIVGRLVG